jgi:hypothetical protein
MKFVLVESSYEELFKDFEKQIKTKPFKNIDKETWATIQLEGIDEEKEKFEPEEYSFIELDIPNTDKEKLKKMNDDIIEKYNQFDIILKATFPNLIDLIDYDKGNVQIIKINGR